MPPLASHDSCQTRLQEFFMRLATDCQRPNSCNQSYWAMAPERASRPFRPSRQGHKGRVAACFIASRAFAAPGEEKSARRFEHQGIADRSSRCFSTRFQSRMQLGVIDQPAGGLKRHHSRIICVTAVG